MPLWLLSLMGNVWVRRTALAAGAALAILLAYEYAYRTGRSAGDREGQERGKAAQVELDKQQYQELKTDFIQKMTDLERQQQVADARYAAVSARANDAAKFAASLATQRDQDRRTVQALPDSEVLRDLTTKLALRDPGDTTPTLYVRELRKADDIVTDYPKLDGQLKAVQAQVAALAEKVDAANGRLDVTVKKLGEVMTWSTQLEGFYVKAYNAVPKRGNAFIRIVTFGLRGKPPRLDIPAPLDLTKLKPAGG